MLELIGRLVPGVLLCGIAGVLCWTFFSDRTLKPDAGKPASFFYPAELVSKPGLWAYRGAFTGSLTLLLFVGYITTTYDDATLKGLNTYLLKSLVQVTPSFLQSAIEPFETLIVGNDFGSATKTIHSFTLTALVALVALVFTPHLIAAYRGVRARFQQLIDENAIVQVRAAARKMAAGNPALALKQLKAKYPALAQPREMESADPELKLMYALLVLVAPKVPEQGIAGALSAILGEELAPERSRGFNVDPNRLAATAFLYLVGCILYIVVVPLWSTAGPNGPQLTLQTRWFCYTCDWIGYDPSALRDLGLQMAQFSAIIVAPFLIGLYFYNSRRRRIPTETRTKATREVLSELFWLPLGASGFLMLLEAVRFHFQPPHGVPMDLSASLMRNGVQDLLMSCIPLLLVWLWASLLEIKSSLLMASIVGSVVAALCCSGIQNIFEAMLRAVDNVQLAFGAHSALLGFYLVSLVGLSALIFLPDVLRSEVEPLAAAASA